MSENSFRSIESAALTGVETTPPLPARTVSHPPHNGVERSPGLFDISDASSRVVVVCNRKPPSVLKELGARHGAAGTLKSYVNLRLQRLNPTPTVTLHLFNLCNVTVGVGFRRCNLRLTYDFSVL